jgi:hypothetical protein
MALSTLARCALVLGAPLLVVACVVDSRDGSGGSYAGGGAGSGGTATVPGDGQPSAHPILAPVDTDQTMNAAPGQGVGVFTEYTHGGHWHVWWTCDNLVSANPPCAFDVKISVPTGQLHNVVTQQFEQGDTFNQGSPQSVEAQTTVSTALDGLTFDTTPGATITLDATVGGQHDGRFIFFVEGGKVDDGYTGTVTDPIQLVGSAP